MKPPSSDTTKSKSNSTHTLSVSTIHHDGNQPDSSRSRRDNSKDQVSQGCRGCCDYDKRRLDFPFCFGTISIACSNMLTPLVTFALDHSINQTGAILQSTLSEDQSKQHAALVSSLTEKASILVNTLDPDDELSFLRIRSKRKEIMVAPDKEFLMMVIQNPSVAESFTLE